MDKALRLAEESIPTEAIIMEDRESPGEIPSEPFEGNPRELADLLEGATRALVEKSGIEAVTALRILAGVEPFNSHPEIVQVAIEELEE